MNKHRLAYFLTVVAILLNIILYWSGVYDPLEQDLYDYRFKLRGPLSGDYLYKNPNELKSRYNTINNEAIKLNHSKDNDVVIIGIDQDSYTNIGRFYPYNRALIWAKVIDNLVAADISVIAFDIMFDNETTSDSVLLNSIKRAEQKGVEIVLAANNKIETGIAGQKFKLIKPSDSIILNTNVKLGLIGTISDQDGFIRRYITFDNQVNDTYQENYYSFALQSVISFTKQSPEIKNDGLKIGDLFIPHYANQNTFLINYFGPNSYERIKTFNLIPLHEVLDDGSCYPEEGDCDPILRNHDSIDGFMEIFSMPEWNNQNGIHPFKNKIAVIGSALKEHHDLFNTPFSGFNNTGEMFGVELHANAIQHILDQNNIQNPISFKGANISLYDKFISFLISMISAFLIFFIMIYFSPIISMILTFLVIFIWFNISIGSFVNDFLWFFKYILNIDISIPNIGNSVILPVIYPISSIILSYGFNLSYKLYNENKNKKFLKNTFGNYISSDLVEEMYKTHKVPELGGKEGYHTLIFSDIASFSSFSEKLSASQLVELLNEYLTEMTQIILNNGGTIDKYIGDAIMAFYGAPLEVENHEYKAVLSVVQMNQKLKDLRIKWNSEEQKWPNSVKNMKHRIGINTGNLVTGNMGSKLQMNYTCMGDAVNLGARLESGAKQWGIDAQVSENVYKKTKDDFVYRELGAIRVKGKEQPINVYELICEKGKEFKNLNKLLDKFKLARKLYLDQKWDEAILAFEESNRLEDNSDPRHTNPSQTYIKICNEFKQNPPGKDWNGVYNFKSK